MSDEVADPPPEEQKTPSVAPTVDDKPKRKSRKSADTKSLPTSVAGELVADQIQRKLIEMVNAVALTEANRRRATAIDVTDYEDAFDLIAGPAKRKRAVAIVADLAGAVGTGLIGYSINVYTSNGSDWTRGHLAMIGGTALLITSIVLKYVTPIK